MTAKDITATISDMLGWGDVDSIESDDASVRKILRHVNLVLKAMQAERNWKELDTSASLMTQEPTTEDTLSVAAVYGQDKITVNSHDFSGTVGALINLNGQKDWYRIVRLASSAVIHLDRPYIGDSITSIVPFVVARDTYQLPDDYDRMTSIRLQCHTLSTYVDLRDDTEIDLDREGGLVLQAPTKFSIRGRTSKGKPTLVFNFLPDDIYSYSYSYQRVHPTLENNIDQVLYPERYSLAIVDQVVARLNSEVEDHQKAMAAASAALSEKVRQGANPDSGERKMRMTPWTGRGRRSY